MIHKIFVLFRSLYFSILFWGKKDLAIDGSLSSGKVLKIKQIDYLRKNFKYFPDKTEISIAMIDNEKVAFVGIKKEKDSLVYVDNKDSVFEIGSITKVFTAILLSEFVNDGLVNLHDPIKIFFDFPLKQSNLNGKEITLKNLANHTSGLPRIDMSMFSGRINIKNPFKNYDEEKLRNYLKDKMKLKSTPGTKFSYSNLGAGLLAYILCKKSNKTYEELLRSTIFRPLTMEKSSTYLSNINSRHIKGLTKHGDIAENWVHTDATAGAGAINSTSADMAFFIQAHFDDNTILQLPLQKTFPVKKNMDVGLAWLITRKDNQAIYWHNGGTGGFKSCIAMDLFNKKGICLLSNISAFHPKNGNTDKFCFLSL